MPLVVLTIVSFFQASVLWAQSGHTVHWVDVVGCSVSGGTLTRNNGSSNWGGAGAASSDSIRWDGAVEFTVQQTNTYRMLGLSNSNADASYQSIGYAIYAASGGRLYVYESGHNRGQVGTYSVGDVLRVERVGSTVYYKRNGSVVYTSNVGSSGVLIADASIYSNGGTINNTVLYGTYQPAVQDSAFFHNFPRGKWVFMGVPLKPSDGDPLQVIGDDFDGEYPTGTNWRVARWNNTHNGYAFYHETGEGGLAGIDPPDFSPGLGYWVVQDVSDNPTVDVYGLRKALGTTDTVALEGPVDGRYGKNMVANPFVHAIDWSMVRVDDGSHTITLSAAVDSGWLSAYAVRWNWSTQSYELLAPDTTSHADTLSEWEGFWCTQVVSGKNLRLIFNNQSLMRPVIGPSLRDMYDRVVVSNTLRAINWEGRIFYSAGDHRSQVLLGVSSWDEPQRGALDVPWFEPPKNNSPHLALRDESGNLALADFESAKVDRWEWQLQVGKGQQTGRLEWSAFNEAPGDIEIGLYRGDEQIADLRQGGNMSLTADHSTYRIIARKIQDVRAPQMAVYLKSQSGKSLVFLVAAEPLAELNVSLGDRALEVSKLPGRAPVWWINLPKGSIASVLRVEAEDAAGNISHYDWDLNIVPENREMAFESGDLEVFISENMPATVGLVGGAQWPVNTPPGELVGDPFSVAVSEGAHAELVISTVGKLPITNLAVYHDTPTGWREIAAQTTLDGYGLRLDLTRGGRYALMRSESGTKETPALPLTTSLGPVFPNPFNGMVVVPFALEQDKHVQIIVYDLMGRQIRKLLGGYKTRGKHRVIWRGRDGKGRPVSSGVYIIALKAGETHLIQRVAYLK